MTSARIAVRTLLDSGSIDTRTGSHNGRFLRQMALQPCAPKRLLLLFEALEQHVRIIIPSSQSDSSIAGNGYLSLRTRPANIISTLWVHHANSCSNIRAAVTIPPLSPTAAYFFSSSASSLSSELFCLISWICSWRSDITPWILPNVANAILIARMLRDKSTSVVSLSPRKPSPDLRDGTHSRGPQPTAG